MSKHTPGAWNIYKGEGSEPIAIYAGKSRHTICDFRIRSNREVLIADARLIAAAPDLLEALEISRGQWIHSTNAEICLAAIKKATS